jgi:hypothetical protein
LSYMPDAVLRNRRGQVEEPDLTPINLTLPQYPLSLVNGIAISSTLRS